MEFLTSLLDGGVTSILGAGIGLVGGWLAKREARKMKQLDHAHEIEMADIDLKSQRLEQDHTLAVADKQIDIAKAEGQIAINAGELDAFNETIKQQGKMTGHLFFDGLKSSIRPLLTLILLGQLFYLQYQLNNLMGGLKALPQDQLMAMFLRIVESIIFLATTATGWWFASRRGQA